MADMSQENKLIEKALQVGVKKRSDERISTDEEIDLVIAWCKGIVRTAQVNAVRPDDTSVQPFLIGVLKYAVRHNKLVKNDTQD